MINTPHLPPRRLGTLERPGCRIHYEVTGSGAAIVFLHGLGGNQQSWFQQVAHFSRHFTCVTFAARGFAPSSPVVGGPEPNDYAGDLAALIEHLGLSHVALVGQSMGGWGSLEYAISHPGKVRALVLAATVGTIDPHKIVEPERGRLAIWQTESQAKAEKLMAANVHVAAGAQMAAEQPSMHLLYRHIDDANATLDKQALLAKLWAARVRPPADLNLAQCPVLFISGDEDIVIPPFAADAIARVAPGAKVAHIVDAGHSAYFERAEKFNAIVEQFLTATRPV